MLARTQTPEDPPFPELPGSVAIVLLSAGRQFSPLLSPALPCFHSVCKRVLSLAVKMGSGARQLGFTSGHCHFLTVPWFPHNELTAPVSHGQCEAAVSTDGPSESHRVHEAAFLLSFLLFFL